MQRFLVIIGNFRLFQAKAFDFVQSDSRHSKDDGVTDYECIQEARLIDEGGQLSGQCSSRVDFHMLVYDFFHLFNSSFLSMF